MESIAVAAPSATTTLGRVEAPVNLPSISKVRERVRSTPILSDSRSREQFVDDFMLILGSAESTQIDKDLCAQTFRTQNGEAKRDLTQIILEDMDDTLKQPNADKLMVQYLQMAKMVGLTGDKNAFYDKDDQRNIAQAIKELEEIYKTSPNRTALGAAARITLAAGALGAAVQAVPLKPTQAEIAAAASGHAITRTAPVRESVIDTSVSFPTLEGPVSKPVERESVNAPEELKPKGMFKDVIVPNIMEYVKGKRPEFQNLKGIDPELNRDGFTFVFMGLGIEEEEFADAIIIAHYNPQDNSITIAKPPRDLHAPENDRARAKIGENIPFTAINEAIIIDKKLGGDGFGVMREIVADSTGFSPDLMMKARIPAVMEAIASSLGTVEIYVPKAVDSTKAGGNYNTKFDVGWHTMNPLEVVNYARSRQGEEGELARNEQQIVVFKALLSNTAKRLREETAFGKLAFLAKLRGALAMEQAKGNIANDFPLDKLVMGVAVDAVMNRSATVDPPEIRSYVFGQAQGLQWEKRENAQSIRPHLVTTGGNYKDPDLRNYWEPMRRGVKNIATKTTDSSGMVAQVN